MIEINLASIIGALLSGVALYFLRMIVNRLDDINGSVRETREDLSSHKLWASDHYVKHADCSERREEMKDRIGV